MCGSVVLRVLTELCSNLQHPLQCAKLKLCPFHSSAPDLLLRPLAMTLLPSAWFGHSRSAQ